MTTLAFLVAGLAMVCGVGSLCLGVTLGGPMSIADKGKASTYYLWWAGFWLIIFILALIVALLTYS